MNISIRPMTPEDADRKGYVHWKSCLETYTGLMDPEFLATSTLEKCRQVAHRWPENILLAELDGEVVGFGSWSVFDLDPLPRHGEITALYVLQEAQGLGIGRRLLEALLEKLSAYREIHLWVLDGNDRAIQFYEHLGFRLDGVTQKNKYSSAHPSLRMVRNLQPHLQIPFDTFFARLADEAYRNVIDETNFYLDGDPEYDGCFLGRLKGEMPFWFGLTADGTQAYEFSTADALVDAPVFRGKSLRQCWDAVRFYSIGSLDPDLWLERYGTI